RRAWTSRSGPGCRLIRFRFVRTLRLGRISPETAFLLDQLALGAVPMLVVPAMRPAFLKPDMIGAFLDPGVTIRCHLPSSPPGIASCPSITLSGRTGAAAAPDHGIERLAAARRGTVETAYVGPVP